MTTSLYQFDPKTLDRALRAAEQAIHERRNENPRTTSGSLAYAALRAAIPHLTWRRDAAA